MKYKNINQLNFVRTESSELKAEIILDNNYRIEVSQYLLDGKRLWGVLAYRLNKRGEEHLSFEIDYDDENSASRFIKDIQKIGTKKFPTQKEVRKSLYADDWYRGKLFNAVIKQIKKHSRRPEKWEEIYIQPYEYLYSKPYAVFYTDEEKNQFVKKNIVRIIKVIEDIEEGEGAILKYRKWRLGWYCDFSLDTIMRDIIKYKKEIKEKGNKK